MSFSLSFLKQDFALNEVTTKDVVRVSRKERGPEDTFMGIRIWNNGAVYPSLALTTALSLEYSKAVPVLTPKTNEAGEPVLDENQQPVVVRTFDASASMACGLDVFDTESWGEQYPKDKPRLLCVAVTLKKEPKVDLFKQTGYEDDGTPLASVMEQGTTTFGKNELLPMLKEVYGIELEKGEYIDLEVATEYRIPPSKTGIYFLPKKVTRGADAGKPDYVRRENINIYPLVPVVATESSDTTIEETAVVQDAIVVSETTEVSSN